MLEVGAVQRLLHHSQIRSYHGSLLKLRPEVRQVRALLQLTPVPVSDILIEPMALNIRNDRSRLPLRCAYEDEFCNFYKNFTTLQLAKVRKQ